MRCTRLSVLAPRGGTERPSRGGPSRFEAVGPLLRGGRRFGELPGQEACLGLALEGVSGCRFLLQPPAERAWGKALRSPSDLPLVNGFA